MAQIVNHKQVATHCDVSLTAVDAWVWKGCPFVTRGTKGVEWELDLCAVEAWLA
jgi:phage terminase Nu1 subunit (DNA packaging protein)